MKRFLFTLLLFISFTYSNGQSKFIGLVQFSGVIVTGDSLKPIPFVSIVIKNSYRGTISDYNGFFSFVAQLQDTIEFAAIGFKKGVYIIPDTLSTDRYSLIKIMTRDTILLQETVIYPWPTKDQFKQAFLGLQVPDNDLERAKRNLALSEMRELMLNTPLDGSGNYKALMMEKQNKLYTAGQYPSISLLNPIAWAKFIEAWQRGDYKSKKKQ
ncbi:MAG: carboxypeptidase-like regulatory domain-containing protein [Bacteroidetes bacterium]|nr:carboxypeptidase-like regulatory domain-containing protein [Bacteroidota bacterium]